MVRRRGRSREGLDAAELVTQPMQGGPERGSASKPLSSIEVGGDDRGVWLLKLPGTPLPWSFSTAAWPIRGAWWELDGARQKGRNAHAGRGPSVARGGSLGCLKRKEEGKERDVGSSAFFTPRRRRRACARALPDGAVADAGLPFGILPCKILSLIA
jgi:hypothetical protein